MLSIQNIKLSGSPDSEYTLRIAEGECIALSGESGSGKTRFLRAIADLDEHEGQVSVNDIDSSLLAANEWRQKVALLPAESVWWFDTIGEHFASYTPHFSTLGFTEDVMQWETSRCSSGEKQRLSILRLLACRPAVLLLDEPTANLDERNTFLVETLIQKYLSKNNACAIWVAHSKEQLARVSEHHYVIETQCLRQVER